MKIKLFILSIICLLSNQLMAQTKENIFYSNGKIYVVVTVISIIFVGILTYLVIIDRRLRKTEKELKQN